MSNKHDDIEVVNVEVVNVKIVDVRDETIENPYIVIVMLLQKQVIRIVI